MDLECVTVGESHGLGAGVELVAVDGGDGSRFAWRTRVGLGERERVLSSAVAVTVHFRSPSGCRGERGEFQCAGVLVERGPQYRVAGVVEDERAPKHQVVDTVVG